MNEIVDCIEIKILFIVLSFLFGAVMGSFLKCQSDRYGKKEKCNRSRCDSCSKVLSPIELIPVVSFLIQKGRCRNCNNPIGKDTLLVEVISGVVFSIIFCLNGITTRCVIIMTVFSIMLIAALIDIRLMIIPNIFTILLIVVWIVMVVFQYGFGYELGVGLIDSLCGAFVIPGFILLVSLLMNKLLKKESLGMGDIKILFGLGLIMGFKLSILNVFIMCIVGIIFAAMQKKRREQFPLMPSICISATFTMLLGNQLLEIYKTII